MPKWAEEKLRNIPVTYLVYAYHGKIKVKRGKMDGCFMPVEGTTAWHAKVPHIPMYLSKSGKVWVKRKEDIPKAKEMVREYNRQRINQIESTYKTAKRNAENIAKGESDNGSGI